MLIKAKKKDATAEVWLSGELDHHSAPAVKRRLDDIISSGATKIILDLSGLRFMDSSGIGVLLGRYQRVKTAGGSIGVRNASKQVDKVFRIAGLYKIIEKK